MPERNIDDERPQEWQGDRRVVIEAKPSVSRGHRTVLGKMVPLSVAKFTEGGKNVAQIALDTVEIPKMRVLARMRANAAQGGTRHAATKIIENQFANGRVRLGRHFHADIAAKGGANPIHALGAEPRDHCRQG